MKNLLLALFVTTSLLSCNQQPKNADAANAQDTATENAIGGEKDAHGCLASAGQTWSELQQNCIQIFNEGLRLNPIEQKENEAVISAFVLLNSEQTKAEVFLPEENGSTILDKTKDNVFENQTLKFDEKEKALYVNGEKKYEAQK